MQVDRLKWMAHDEARTPWVMKLRAKKNENPVEAEVLLRGALLIVARAVEATVSWTEVSRWAAELTHNNSDNFRGSLCHLPGWHTNSEEDTIERREDTPSNSSSTWLDSSSGRSGRGGVTRDGTFGTGVCKSTPGRCSAAVCSTAATTADAVSPRTNRCSESVR